MAQVGQPQMKTLEDSKDGKTRWVQLQVPITEGQAVPVGDFKFEGNKVVNSEALRPLFKIEAGETYSQKKVKKGFEKAQEVYGSGGYFEFTAYPDLQPRDRLVPRARRRRRRAPAPPGRRRRAAPLRPTATRKDGLPLVDVTMRVEEGKQYFVNRITFTGNTTTRDNVIRRELRLVESGVFNTEALKYSVKRLNQLGYFKPLEGEAIDVEKTPNADNKVDIKLKFEEQNRNQLTFGAGVSQFDGFFGQLSFQTSNFLGRGETFTRLGAAGQPRQELSARLHRAVPLRPADDGRHRHLHRARFATRASSRRRRIGGNLVFGFQVMPFARMFVNYSSSTSRSRTSTRSTRIRWCSPAIRSSRTRCSSARAASAPSARSARASSTTPSITRSSRRRDRATRCRWTCAGIGGNTNFVNPRAEGIMVHSARRQAPHVDRASARRPSTSSRTAAPIALPIFERLFLGGEYSMRGFDLRTVGPRDPVTGLVLGGNKSLLFNVEYLINIAGPVRLVLFYDAGQVRDTGREFAWKEPVTQITYPQARCIPDPSDFYQIRSIRSRPASIRRSRTIGETSAFKTSTGAEIRFFMPVLNVPFRLIFAVNPSRGGVLDNNLQPEKKCKFRFAVGSTF